MNDIQELARAKSAADKAYADGMRKQLQVYKPTTIKKFWPTIDALVDKVVGARRNGFSPPIKSAVHNLFCDQVWNNHDTLAAWEDMARFLAQYEDLKGLLSKKLWDMPGIAKGDDSYGDLIDSLPLAGQEVVEGLLGDDIANWKQLEAAMLPAPLKDFILEGENYVEMKFEEKLVESFLSVARAVEEVDDDTIL